MTSIRLLINSVSSIKARHFVLIVISSLQSIQVKMKLLVFIAIIYFVQCSPTDWSTVENLYPKVPGIRDRRIYRGEPAEPHSIPWQAGILTTHTDIRTGRWGGSLITTRSVLAAAHSFNSPLVQTIIILGAHYITRLEDTQQRFYIPMENHIRHPDWEEGPGEFKLDSSFLEGLNFAIN